jgi:hypothetical protein
VGAIPPNDPSAKPSKRIASAVQISVSSGGLKPVMV